MTAGIGCRDVVVRAGGRVILDVPRLDVAPGETLALLGGNGAGKSTLLRALALLRQDRTGTVLLDGVPAGRAELRHAVAAVLQRPVVRRGSVRRNVASGLLLRGTGRREAYRRSGAWLERLGIAHLAGQAARSLSGGERQRVAIARALAVAPRVLLLDEPFAGLDAATRSDLLADLRAVLDDPGLTTVLVTHDRDEAGALAHRTALLVDGHLRQVGRTQDVLDNPTDADCARLVGYSNVLPPALTGLPATMVCRPEDCMVVPADAEPPTSSLVLAARLVRTVPLGGITRLDVAVGTVPLACLVAGRLADDVGGARPGDAVTMAVRLESLRHIPSVGDGTADVVGRREAITPT